MPELVATYDLQATIFRAYREHYDRIAEDDLKSSIQLEDHLEIETARLHAALGDLRGRDVCDVGTGRGLLFDRLRNSSVGSVTGVDLAIPYLRRLVDPQDPRVVLANAERLPFREQFDLIVSTDVLEHVLNPGDLLVSMAQALRQNGRLVVRVPYRDNLVTYSTLKGYRYRFVHLRAFDESGLQELLGQAGFAVEGVAWSGFYTSRLRSRLVRNRRLGRRITQSLERHYGGPGKVTRIRPRVGRLLMRPNTLTVTAMKRPPDG